jgi:F0F1-type ATP synthase membrane subunit b/b'
MVNYCVSACILEFRVIWSIQKAELASKEKSKASAVAINAELRRTKARLLEEVPKLQRLAVKKVSLKTLSSDFLWLGIH